MSDIDVLFPTDREVRAGGELFVIKPMRFGQQGRAAQLMRPITKQLAAAFNAAESLTVPTIAAMVVDLMADCGEELYQAIGFFIGKPREWFDTIEMDEGYALAIAIFEVNRDFFNRRILPMLAKGSAAEPQTGATSSQSSSQMATAEATSTATP